MASYKVYRSGNNYEVYEYEEPAHNNLEHVQIFNDKKSIQRRNDKSKGNAKRNRVHNGKKNKRGV